MNNIDTKIITEKYENILLEADLGRVFGNQAMDLIRYFRCKRGESVGGVCPDPVKVIDNLKKWAQLHQQEAAARIIMQATAEAGPEQALVNIYNAVKGNIHNG